MTDDQRRDYDFARGWYSTMVTDSLARLGRGEPPLEPLDVTTHPEWTPQQERAWPYVRAMINAALERVGKVTGEKLELEQVTLLALRGGGDL